VWRRGKLTAAAKPLWGLLLLAVILAVAVQGLVFRSFHGVGLIGLIFGFWIMLSALLETRSPIAPRAAGPESAARHGGCALRCRLFAIGASGVESYKIEKDVALKPGGSSPSPATISVS